MPHLTGTVGSAVNVNPGPEERAKRRSAELLERFDLAGAAGRSVKT